MRPFAGATEPEFLAGAGIYFVRDLFRRAIRIIRWEQKSFRWRGQGAFRPTTGLHHGPRKLGP